MSVRVFGSLVYRTSICVIEALILSLCFETEGLAEEISMRAKTERSISGMGLTASRSRMGRCVEG